MNSTTPKAIAFYLPQFHPIPENNQWWGEGFTEWTNVTKCTPRFRGHYQPHLPTDLGFYDLRCSESMCQQAELAKQYGIYGFCFYHYWFGGRKILERPVEQLLSLGVPQIPFCLCWANENWTRSWDGQTNDVLLSQEYSDDDDLKHIRYLANCFQDARYIRIDGKPLFMVYRASAIPNPLRTTDLWRNEAKRLGIGEIYLCRVESFASECISPGNIGFDAAVEFAPDWECLGKPRFNNKLTRAIYRLTGLLRYYINNRVTNYDDLVRNMLRKSSPTYDRFPCVTPMWDNSARRQQHATVVHGATPAKYEQWLREVATRCRRNKIELLFVNAWNEWAEGNHLEPCHKWGRSYLEATKQALLA